MGYACPVCATPQRDGEHLAHHLAFTAMLHGDDHEAWLDDRVPDWADREPAGLAAEVTPHADDAEYHEVFEDTVDRGRPDVDGGLGTQGPGGHGHSHDRGVSDSRGAVDETGVTDPETAAALREARDLTRRMFEDEDDESETGAGEGRSSEGDDGSSGHDGDDDTDGDNGSDTSDSRETNVDETDD